MYMKWNTTHNRSTNRIEKAKIERKISLWVFVVENKIRKVEFIPQLN